MNMNKKLIGYKLKDETLIPVIQLLIEIEAHKSYNWLKGGVTVGTGVNFIPRSCLETIRVLKHTGILDLWYEPVYEEEMSIGNLKVTFNDNSIKIGCKKITIDHIIIHL